MNIPLNFTQEEVNFIQNVLGELPSKTGAAFLMKKIKDQIDAAANIPLSTTEL